MEKRKNKTESSNTLTFADLDDENKEEGEDEAYLEQHKAAGKILTKVMFLDPNDYYRNVG